MFLLARQLGHTQVRGVRMMRTGLKGAMWEKRVQALATMEVMKMRALNAVGLWVLTMRRRA